MIASLTDQATPARVYPYCAPHTAEMIADLSRRAYEYRTQVLRMVYGRKSGHIGGAFSIAEILTCLYFHQLRIDPANPKWEDRDRLVFSKGHACAMLYTCLAHRGFFPVEELPTAEDAGRGSGCGTAGTRRGHCVWYGVVCAYGRVQPQHLRHPGRWRIE